MASWAQAYGVDVVSDQLRVLTVRQPWAWAIIHGGKDVENRTRNIAGDYRGPVAIHAAREWDDALFVVPQHPALHEALVRARQELPSYSALQQLLDDQRGHVIGVVDLVDVHVRVPGDQYTKWCSPWAEPDHFHLVIENPRPLAKAVPARGFLSLWRPDEALAAAIWEQVAA